MARYIIDFPDDLHKTAKAKAALLGMSLKDLIIQAVREYIKTHKAITKKGGK
jgi:predicted HicB family RNase H-like nuclease